MTVFSSIIKQGATDLTQLKPACNHNWTAAGLYMHTKKVSMCQRSMPLQFIMSESASRTGANQMVRPERIRKGPVVLLWQWHYLSLPVPSQPPWATITDCSFMSGWGRNIWLLRGLHACCMGCCGDNVGVSDYVSWSTVLPNQKQDKWKSSKQSCCQENSFQHLSKDSVDYSASFSLGPVLLTHVILVWYI